VTLRERARTHVRFLRGESDVAALEPPAGCEDSFLWRRTLEALASLEAPGITGEHDVLEAYAERLIDLLVAIEERSR
jgi:hypothetical protein